MDTEAGPFPRLGVEANLAPDALQGLVDNRQADTGAGVLVGAVHALEHAEDFIVACFGNTDAVVLNPDENAVR